MSPKVAFKVKEKIERLVKADFIKTTQYREWLPNVVPMMKKNGELIICIDFRNLNLDTPKDDRSMPVTF